MRLALLPLARPRVMPCAATSHASRSASSAASLLGSIRCGMQWQREGQWRVEIAGTAGRSATARTSSHVVEVSSVSHNLLLAPATGIDFVCVACDPRCSPMLWLCALAGTLLAASFTCGSSLDCAGVNAVSPKCQTHESAYHRDVFYIGGGYVASGIPGELMWANETYIEKLTPAGHAGVTQPHPIVFISPGLPSGSVWLNTPDNRKGWASYFLDAGYQVYIVDITANGRSGQNLIDDFPLRIGSTDIINEEGFTAPEILDAYPQSQGHTQWPGNGTRGDPIFDAFTASTVTLSSSEDGVELTMRSDMCEILSLIGPSYTICHSAGCTYSALITDQCPELLRANINIEPGNIPFQSLIGNDTFPSVGYTPARPCGLTYTLLNYDPPITNCSQIYSTLVGQDNLANRSCYIQNPNSTIHTLPQFKKVPYVMFTGSASPHITYDHCFVEFFDQIGINITWIKLGEIGIKGNGHFMYLEENNLRIAEVVKGVIRHFDGLGGSLTGPW